MLMLLQVENPAQAVSKDKSLNVTFLQRTTPYSLRGQYSSPD